MREFVSRNPEQAFKAARTQNQRTHAVFHAAVPALNHRVLFVRIRPDLFVKILE